MGKIIGVARISTKQQSIDRQIRNIQEIYPNAQIIKLVVSGAKVIGYEDFEKVIKEARSGDKLIFDSASRMSRNSQKGCELYEDLFNRGIDIEFLKEPQINTAVFKKTLEQQISMDLTIEDEATKELMKTIIEALNKYTIALAKEQIKKVFDQAEKELLDLHQRTSEGMQTAKLKGKQIGTPRGAKLITKKSIKAKEIILKHSKTFNGSLKDSECIKLAEIDRGTYYKYKKELLEERSTDIENT